MSAKVHSARRRAFLRALAATGNQTLAAEHAKVSRSWVVLHRKEHPDFDAACLAAVAQAKAALALAPERRPPPGWGFLDGAELVVKGSGGSGGGRRTQIARARPRQWTARAEARFLTALAASCNVKAACADVGLSVSSAYAHRRRWAPFARHWNAAIEVGYVRIEAALIDNACHYLAPADEPPPEAPLRDMTVAHAIHIVGMRGRRRRD